MDKLQGGDWNSFFSQFEAVASQSPANVSRPSIVDDNVPLPIIRGHQFDIAYQDTVDEHVKCQVCGMLLRRTMFAAHVRQRHPELIPPSLSTDDDSGRHSGLESPDISRNSNFPFSPKLMSPPIATEPIKLTISLKGHRKHKRRKTKRERRGEEVSLTSAEEELQHSPSAKEASNEDPFFWPGDDRPGPSTQRSTPSFLDRRTSPSSRVKPTESHESVEDVITRISPHIRARAELEDSSDEDSKKRRRRKSRRKPRKKDHDKHDTAAPTSAARSRVLPAVEPLRLAITPEGARVIGNATESSREHHSPQVTCRAASQTERNRPETRSLTNSQQAATRSAFTDLIQSFPATSHILPTAQPFSHFSSQPTTSRASETVSGEIEEITVGQPAKRAERSDAVGGLFPESSPVATVLAPSSWVYSQSQIATDSPIVPTYNTRSVRKATVESGSFRAEAVPFDPFIKPSAILEPEAAKPVVAEATLPDEELADSGLSENRRPILPQRKTRQPSGSQESWEPLGIKSPTYGVVLPVAPKQDNDADDATVAFLTSSPELLSEDDAQVKEEVEDVQSALGMSPSRLLRQKFRSATSATSESTDTDYRTIIDVEEDQAERRSSDRDGEIQSLANRLAALAQESVERRKVPMEQDLKAAIVEVEKVDASEIVNVASARSQAPVEETIALPENEPAEGRISRGSLVFTPETNYIPVLDGTFDDLLKSGQLSEYRNLELTGEVLAHSAVDQSILQREYEETLVREEELVPSQRLAAEVRTLSIESERSENPIGVLVTARTDSLVEEGFEARLSLNPALTPRERMMKYRQEEELSSYEEDYSAEDDELVDLHESSVSNYHDSEQQSQYEQMLRQRTPSSVTPTGPIYPQTSHHANIMSQEIVRQSVEAPQWLSSFAWQNQSEPLELRVQTAFEGSSKIEVHHSEPIPQRLSTQRPSMPNSFQYGTSPLQHNSQKQPPPHSFPLQKDHGQKVEVGQWSIPQLYRAQVSQPLNYHPAQNVPYKAPDQQQLTYGQQGSQLSQFTYQQTQFQPYKRQPVVSVPSLQPHVPQFPPVSYHQAYGQPVRQELRHQQQQYGLAMQEVQPSELLEEEMRAMRYVYLMNEQRHAKKILAEQDKKLSKKSDLPTDLMLLTELPPIIIEPTVVPEGVSRYRMQEHILPPYHHAQYVARDGPSLSPHKSEADDDSSEDELRKLFDVLDLLQLEPPIPRPRISADAQHSPRKAHNALHQSLFQENQRQQYPSGGSHRSGPLPPSELSQNVSVQAPMPPAFPISASQTLQPLEVAIPEMTEAIISEKSHSISEEESELSLEEGLAGKADEALQKESSDDSTDTEGIRRQWDLSPSVSPLTLEALASGLSSPEGSDSNDGQSGMPVWPTISRKHAKLAIAACRNMPKRFQPLCRRFAWQQGITYLLENFCLKKWEIRPEHDNESVWFFERNVRRFKPFELEPWQIPEGNPEDENDFYGFNICADIPVQKCSKTLRLEDHATVSFSCYETPGDVELSSTDDEGYSDEETEYASSVYYDVDDIAPSSLKLIPSSGGDGEKKIVLESSEDETDDEETDEDEVTVASVQQRKAAAAISVHQRGLPQKLSYEKQEFIARSCCKQFLQQMVLRKKGECFRTAGKSAVEIKVLLSDLYQEHRDAYELMIADTIELPTPDQREIPFSDDAEWVASRILAINRAQNRLLVPSFPPWTVMQRMWKVYGPLRQAAAAIGGDYEKFVNECVNVAYNQYYRLKNGIKVADEIPGDLLDLCYAITCERMREHSENVEALKRKPNREPRKTKRWLTLKPREGPPPIPSQRTANANLLSRCRLVYDEKRQTKRRRWNAMRYLHNTLPGCVIEGIDVFDMAQRTNLSVAGMFGPEHKVGLSEMPFASDMDNRPAYLDMEELLDLMDHTLALQSGTTVDQEGKPQPSVDFLTVRGLHFKAVTGERGRCHLMVSPSAIPVPPVTVDRYGNMTSVQRAAVPIALYSELVSRKVRGDDDEQFCRAIEPPAQNDEITSLSADDCPECLRTTEDYADMDFARTCLNGLPQDLAEEVDELEIDTENTTYRSPQQLQKLMSNEELIKLL